MTKWLSSNPSYRVSVYGNLITNTIGEGAKSSYSSYDNSFIGNHIYNANRMGANIAALALSYSTYQNTVMSNTVDSTAGNCGIWVIDDSHDNTIIGNIVNNSVWCGIGVGKGYSGSLPSYNNIVSNNIVKGSAHWGIYFGYSVGTSDTNTYNNTAYGNTMSLISDTATKDDSGLNVMRDNMGANPFGWGNRPSAPTPFGAGDQFYNTSSNKMAYYNGTNWIQYP